MGSKKDIDVMSNHLDRMSTAPPLRLQQPQPIVVHAASVNGHVQAVVVVANAAPPKPTPRWQ